MSMLSYIIRRLLILLPVLFGTLTLIFILSKFMPGDPAYSFLPQNFTHEQYLVIRHWLGLDRPLLIQYFDYLGDLFTGNWGLSTAVSNRTPVWTLIWQRFPRTMELSLFSVIIASYAGIKTGVISAKHRNKPKDTIIRGISLLGVSMPVFWLGTILQYLLTYQIDLFPAVNFKTPWYPDPPFITGFRLIDSLISGKIYLFTDALIHLMLPVACLSFITLASITRQTRSSMLEVLQLDYIRTARAKGCDERAVINKHALKNALIPTTTIIGLTFGGLLSGAILTETTFSLHGMGELLIQAIVRYDYYVINASVFLIAVIFVVINLCMDILYGVLDPRIRY